MLFRVGVLAAQRKKNSPVRCSRHRLFSLTVFLDTGSITVLVVKRCQALFEQIEVPKTSKECFTNKINELVTVTAIEGQIVPAGIGWSARSRAHSYELSENRSQFNQWGVRPN